MNRIFWLVDVDASNRAKLPSKLFPALERQNFVTDHALDLDFALGDNVEKVKHIAVESDIEPLHNDNLWRVLTFNQVKRILRLFPELKTLTMVPARWTLAEGKIMK
jgi:hypothetical protein